MFHASKEFGKIPTTVSQHQCHNGFTASMPHRFYRILLKCLPIFKNLPLPIYQLLRKLENVLSTNLRFIPAELPTGFSKHSPVCFATVFWDITEVTFVRDSQQITEHALPECSKTLLSLLLLQILKRLSMLWYYFPKHLLAQVAKLFVVSLECAVLSSCLIRLRIRDVENSFFIAPWVTHDLTDKQRVDMGEIENFFATPG